MNSILKLTNLSKSYGKATVLNSVSFTLQEGHIYGLIGANGAGKTTLMKCVSGLSFPTAGQLTLFGETSEAGIQLARKRIGSMIEAPALILEMTAKENLTYQRLLRGIPNVEIVDELLHTVGLSDAMAKKAKDFSLGMKQRLGIAIALLASPELLVLDEPVNGLDPIGVVEVRQLLKKLCEERGMTILISSHNLPELYQTATDYLIIHRGQLIKELTLAQLDEACKQHILIECAEPSLCVRVIEEVLQFSAYKVMPNGAIKLFEGLNNLGHISTTLVKEGVILTRFGIEGDTLEGYFVSLIGGEQHV